jgi:AhpD family alkylhydroperoxidase
MEYQRISLDKTEPKLYQGVFALEKQVNECVAAAKISEGFAHLLRLRASQLNGCAYCVRMHTRDALASGESTDRISVLPAWRETAYFTVKERASLALIEAVTLISEDQVPDPVYAQATSALSKEEVSAVEWLGVMINVWNRIAISSRTPVNP